jgi:hypothetical protein
MDQAILEPQSAENEEQIDSGYIPEDDAALTLSPAERRLITQPYDLTVRTIIGQIDDKSLIVNPPYQRGYVWDDARASKLIESLLMNIPIPPCYFAEEESGVLTVIDGQQRLRSVWRFAKDGFTLRGLKALPEYNNLKFSKLKERDQRVISGRTIRCIVITQESHPEIRFEVFERLNTGAMQLSDQEIRNAIFRGDFNNLIKSLAEQPRWIGALGKQKLDKRMRDDELVVRLFAVNNGLLEYQAPLRTFLNNFTRSMVRFPDKRERKLSKDEMAQFTSLFENTVDKVTKVFNGHAFRVYNNNTQNWESQINRALFDAVTLVFSRLPLDVLLAHRIQIEKSLIQLCANPEFLTAISRSTADRGSFFKRIRMFSEAMAVIGLDSGIHQIIPKD